MSVTKETRFSTDQPSDDEGEEANEVFKDERSPVKESPSKRKESQQLMTEDETTWIKNTIRTKVKNEDGIIEEVPTKAFGVIDFKGSTRKAKAKFVQLSDTTQANTIFTLLTRYWKLARPQIVISITGGAKLFKMEDDLKDNLFEGLRKIAESPGTWIITGGTNTGIMKFIGENLQGICSSLIGIATWGVITNADKLYGDKEKLSLGETFPYEVASSITSNKTFLDQNHTHFLLADDSSTGEYGKEIKLCSNLIKYVAHDKEPKVPSIMILIEGGLNSIRNVVNAVSEPSIPVLVVKNSGRAADIIAHAVNNKQHFTINDYELLKEYVEQELGYLNDEGKEIVINNIKECLEHSKMITVFDPEDEEGIDKKILKAVLSCYKLPLKLKLQYTVLWNRVDVAHNLILENFSLWKETDLNVAITMALALNRFKLVEYFFEQNISIHKMLTRSFVEFLYGHRSTRRRSGIIKTMLTIKDSEKEHKPFFDELALAIADYQVGKSNVISYDKIFDFIQLLCDDMQLVGNEEFVTPPDKLTDEECSKHPYRDLFLWSVVNNMQDMSKLLWRLGDEQIAKAIVAAHISKVLAQKCSENTLSDEIVHMYENNALEFENLALKVLDSCYSENTEKTKRMLTIELDQFQQQNCLSLAHASSFEQFIAHTAVQNILKDLWLGYKKFERNMIQFKEEIPTATLHLKNQADANEARQSKAQRHDATDQLIPSKDGNKNYNTIEPQETSTENKKSKRIQRGNYMDVPIGKFYLSLGFYCIFLLLLSYLAMLKKDSTKPGFLEIIVFIWVISIATEEIYQMAITPGVTLSRKLKEYFSSIFNIIDFFAVVIYFIAFALQLSARFMEYGHLIYAFDAWLWIIRLLQSFYSNKILGPYVLMIGRMFYDMMFFISILGVFLLAHGVLSSAILKPETTIYKMLVNVIYHPYFQVYGELFSDRDPEAGATRFGTPKLNSYSEPLAWIALGVFLLIANVLLLNLLIAIFGNTFAEVQEKSDEIWKFKRYGLITEFTLKLPLPPPFTIFALLYKILTVFLKTRREKKMGQPEVADIERENVGQFQIKNVGYVLHQQKIDSQESLESKKLEDLYAMMTVVKNQITNLQKPKDK